MRFTTVVAGLAVAAGLVSNVVAQDENDANNVNAGNDNEEVAADVDADLLCLDPENVQPNSNISGKEDDVQADSLT